MAELERRRDSERRVSYPLLPLRSRRKRTLADRAPAGRRTIEEGADVSKVYTFAWLLQAAVSVACRR